LQFETGIPSTEATQCPPGLNEVTNSFGPFSTMSIRRPWCLTALVTISLFGVSVTLLGQGKELRASEAKYHIGQQATVCGRVVGERQATTRGKPTFLDFNKPYPDQAFSVIIWGKNLPKFGSPESAYTNKTMCATGRIGSHRGMPEMIISDPSHLSADIEKAELLQEGLAPPWGRLCVAMAVPHSVYNRLIGTWRNLARSYGAGP
jgi:hypothetical protein